jgi:AraC family transcriptional regulator
VPGLVLAEVDYARDARVCETHSHARFVLVLRGALDLEGQHGASALWFCAPGETHTFRAGASGARCLILDMEPGWFARVRQGVSVLTASIGFSAGLVTHLAHRLHDEFRRRDEISRLAIESLAIGVVAEASRRAKRAAAAHPPAWLERARLFVDQHLAERLALATVAAIVGVHPVHLARTFRRTYDTTFSGYVRTMRVEFARQQLATTHAPLGDIAAAAGFYDQSHFCRLFKQATGVSPAAYRVAMRSR